MELARSNVQNPRHPGELLAHPQVQLYGVTHIDDVHNGTHLNLLLPLCLLLE